MHKIKKGDEVIITTGKDKGKRGAVLKIVADDRVLVESCNMAKKHVKANPMRERLAALSRKRCLCIFPMLLYLTWQQVRVTVLALKN